MKQTNERLCTLAQQGDTAALDSLIENNKSFIFIVGILLILCADTTFLWYAFNQNVRLTVVAGILIALVGGVGVIMNLWCILKELYSK